MFKLLIVTQSENNDISLVVEFASRAEAEVAIASMKEQSGVGGVYYVVTRLF